MLRVDAPRRSFRRQVGDALFFFLVACTPLAAPLPHDAEAIAANEIPDLVVDWVGEPQPYDSYYLWQLPAEEGVVSFIRIRPGGPPLLFATACATLLKFELPDGWTGVCHERVTGGRRMEGPFTYEEAALRG
jgi:hypothetical protein